MNKRLLLLTLLGALSLSSAQAADSSARKFGRGLAGMMELPGNLIKETEQKGAAGFPLGLAKGVGMIVTRELVGVYEFISAPFPVPAGFKPILSPEYPWSYFN